MKYYIGTSGWHYEHWKGNFYPRNLCRTGWLDFYSRSFSTVELNNSFYRLPAESAFINWRESSPEGFIYSVKVSRFITHMKKLRDCEGPLNTFIDRAKLLGGKLGPLLYQLPRGVKRNSRVLESFIGLLPRDERHVFEFRDSSWFENDVFDILRSSNIGFCIYDMPGLSTPLAATADFAYIRFHGSRDLYGGCYSRSELESWAGRIAALNAEKVFAYFNNDAGGFAVQNSMTLKQLLEKG